MRGETPFDSIEDFCLRIDPKQVDAMTEASREDLQPADAPASVMPLCVDVPNVAWFPVSEPYSPTTMSPVVAAFPAAPPPVSDFGGHPASASERRATVRDK